MAVYTDRDGNTYHSVIIGTQEWIVENLKTIHYKDGSVVPLVEDAADWARTGDCEGMDALYNWWATAKNSGTGIGSIAPIGWHIPSETEWQILKTYLINNNYGYGGSGDDIGKSIASTTGWDVDATPGNVGNYQTSNNSSKFNVRPSGIRVPITGIFYGLGQMSYFWSSTNDSSSPNPIITFGTSFDGNYFEFSHYHQTGGESIRCLANSTTKIHGQTGTVTDIDGNIYPTICIGTQEWMASNLKVEHFNDGTDIPIVTDDAAWAALTTDAMCYYNNTPCIIHDAYCWYNNLK
jgi:uncharacterized protein (TIGR02145 family)